MICISQKRNQKLLDTFNNDSNSDRTIVTELSQLSLVRGYLLIDSQFFEEVGMNVAVVDLSHLPEGPTLKVLRSLYGEELIAGNVNELRELHAVIRYLKISDYEENIEREILAHPHLMDSIELIELCFSWHMLEKEIK
jgi:hypothetical protein